MLARITMRDITIISSMSVKPGPRDSSLDRLATPCTSRRTGFGIRRLPVTVLRPIQSGPAALRIHVEHVLSAPGGRIRFVLIGPQPPLGVVRHRINRNPAEEF